MMRFLAQVFVPKQTEVVVKEPVKLPYSGPFDLKKALQGAPICFRSGKPCEIENISADGMVLVSFKTELNSNHDGKALETCLAEYYSNGFANELEESEHDLMMAI